MFRTHFLSYKPQTAPTYVDVFYINAHPTRRSGGLGSNRMRTSHPTNQALEHEPMTQNELESHRYLRFAVTFTTHSRNAA